MKEKLCKQQRPLQIISPGEVVAVCLTPGLLSFLELVLLFSSSSTSLRACGFQDPHPHPLGYYILLMLKSLILNEKKIFHLWFHASMAATTQVEPSQSLAAQNSIRLSHIRGRHCIWTICCCLPRQLSRELDQKSG